MRLKRNQKKILEKIPKNAIKLTVFKMGANFYFFQQQQKLRKHYMQNW